MRIALRCVCCAPSVSELARSIAVRWLSTALRGWEAHGLMFEKYDADGTVRASPSADVDAPSLWDSGTGPTRHTTPY